MARGNFKKGNLSMHITAWDKILLYVPWVHSDVITSDFNNLHQYTTTEQVLIVTDNVIRKLCLPPLQTIDSSSDLHETSVAVLHKSTMWVHRIIINTALNVYRGHCHRARQWTSTSLSSEVSDSSSLVVSTYDVDTSLLT